MGRLSRGKAMEFLVKGSMELGIEIGHSVIEKAVDVLNSIVG